MDPENGQLFTMMITTNGLLGVAYTLTVFNLVKLGGPIMVNISGTMKDVGLTYIGFAFFDDSKVTNKVLIGLGISFAGASYTLAHRIKQHREQQQEVEAEADPEAEDKDAKKKQE